MFLNSANTEWPELYCQSSIRTSLCEQIPLMVTPDTGMSQLAILEKGEGYFENRNSIRGFTKRL